MYETASYYISPFPFVVNLALSKGLGLLSCWKKIEYCVVTRLMLRRLFPFLCFSGYLFRFLGYSYHFPSVSNSRIWNSSLLIRSKYFRLPLKHNKIKSHGRPHVKSLITGRCHYTIHCLHATNVYLCTICSSYVYTDACRDVT